MSKGTVSLRDAGGASRSFLAEQLPGGLAQILFVATAIPTVVDWQELTVGGTVGTLATFCAGASLPSGATHALFRVYDGGGDVRWIDDAGSDPTTSSGFPAAAGEWGEWVNLAGIKLVATQAGTKVGVSFRRYDA